MALFAMLIYIGFRFEPVYGVGATVAVIHDVLVTLALVSLFNYEISLNVIAAFMTLVGYSVNDTIVIFDRVRENRHIHRRLDLGAIVNLSINQTLRRTVLTSGLTLLAVGALLTWGGEVLRAFSFVLVAGVFVGTYSSIAIASPIVLWWRSVRGGTAATASSNGRRRPRSGSDSPRPRRRVRALPRRRAARLGDRGSYEVPPGRSRERTRVGLGMPHTPSPGFGISLPLGVTLHGALLAALLHPSFEVPSDQLPAFEAYRVHLFAPPAAALRLGDPTAEPEPEHAAATVRDTAARLAPLFERTDLVEVLEAIEIPSSFGSEHGIPGRILGGAGIRRTGRRGGAGFPEGFRAGRSAVSGWRPIPCSRPRTNRPRRSPCRVPASPGRRSGTASAGASSCAP